MKPRSERNRRRDQTARLPGRWRNLGAGDRRPDDFVSFALDAEPTRPYCKGMETNNSDSDIRLVSVSYLPGTPDPAPGVYPGLWSGYEITSPAIAGTTYATDIGNRSRSGIAVEIVIDSDGLASARHAAI